LRHRVAYLRWLILSAGMRLKEWGKKKSQQTRPVPSIFLDLTLGVGAKDHMKNDHPLKWILKDGRRTLALCFFNKPVNYKSYIMHWLGFSL
jgi:hypothetical protein